MLKRQIIQPESMWKKVEGGYQLYSQICVVPGADHAHIYLAGQVPRDPRTGEVVGKGDMRAQIRRVCENIKIGLEHVGATFHDVVRTITFTTNIDEYYRCSDERFKNYFTGAPPPSTLIQIDRLGTPEMMIEIEVEAIIEPERLRV